MHHLFFRFYGILSIFLFANLYSATAITITNHSISHQNPSCHDEISYTIHIMTPTTPCQPLVVDSTVSGNNFNFSVRHEWGMLQAICERSDTYYLGSLPAGSYTIEHHVYQTDGMGGIVSSDQVIIQFTVSGSGCDPDPEPEPDPEFDFHNYSGDTFCTGDTILIDALVKNFDTLNVFEFSLIDLTGGFIYPVNNGIVHDIDSIWSFELYIPPHFPSGHYVLLAEPSTLQNSYQDTVVLSIQNKPLSPQWSVNDLSICINESLPEVNWANWESNYDYNLLVHPSEALDSMNINPPTAILFPNEHFTGTFEVELYHTNECGMSDTIAALDISVHPLPIAEIIQLQDFEFETTATGIYSWYLDSVHLEQETQSVIDIKPYLPAEFESIELMLEVTSPEGCTNSDLIMLFFTSTGEKVNINQNINVFQRHQSIRIDNLTDKVIEEILIYDLNGRVIEHINNNIPGQTIGYELNTGNFSSGLYLFKIHLEDGVVTGQKVFFR